MDDVTSLTRLDCLLMSKLANLLPTTDKAHGVLDRAVRSLSRQTPLVFTEITTSIDL